MFKKYNPHVHFATTHLKDDEVKTQPHLAYDLRDIDELTKQGKAISMNSVESMFTEGQENCQPEVPLDNQRGVNINDLWLASENAKDKLSRAKVKNVNVNPLTT